MCFLLTSSTDTSNLSNQEQVWLAEQKAKAEAQKVKELQTQIQLEREKEEFEKLAGKKSKGDRGVNWMYEEGGGPAYGEDAELVAAKEEEQNEAYLLGKEYVPKGQEKHVGDFAVAATMGGVLEKASTRGATIGAGEIEDSTYGRAEVRLKDENEEVMKDDDNGRSEFNREFHLRHEDPMFAVHRKREMQRKDVEKRRNLMERAGLVIKEVKRGNDDRQMSPREHDEDRKRKHSKKRKRHHKHRQRRDRSSSVSSRSSSSSREHRSHRKKREKKCHHHRSRRHERRRDRSTSRESSLDSMGDAKYHGHGGKDTRKYTRDRSISRERSVNSRSDEKYYGKNDKEGKSNRQERSNGRKRSEERWKDSKGNGSRHRCNDDDNLDEFGRKRHHSSEKQQLRDSGRHQNHSDHQHGRHLSTKLNDEKDRFEGKRRENSDSKDAMGREEQPPKKEGYGLIGTSLSGKRCEGRTNNLDAKRHISLGPNDDLLIAKRKEVEQNRQTKLEQSRRSRWNHDDRSRESRLKDMEYNAQNRR